MRSVAGVGAVILTGSKHHPTRQLYAMLAEAVRNARWRLPAAGRLTALNGMSTVITKDPIMRRTIDRVVFDVPARLPT